MTFENIPYFMTNKTWYYHDIKEFKYKLTKEGKYIKKVVDSYNEFYSILENNIDGDSKHNR